MLEAGKERQQEAAKAAAASRAATAAEHAAAAATAEVEALRVKLSAALEEQAAARAVTDKQAKLAAKQEKLCRQLQQELEARQLDVAVAGKQLTATQQELLEVKRQAAAALRDLDGVREEVAAWSSMAQPQSKGAGRGSLGVGEAGEEVGRQQRGSVDVLSSFDQGQQQGHFRVPGKQQQLRGKHDMDGYQQQEEEEQWQRRNYQQQLQQQPSSKSGEELLQQIAWLAEGKSLPESVREEPSFWQSRLHQKAAVDLASDSCITSGKQTPRRRYSRPSTGLRQGVGCQQVGSDMGALSPRAISRALGRCLDLKSSQRFARTAAAAAGAADDGSGGLLGAGVEAAWEVEAAFASKDEQLQEARAEVARLQVRRCDGKIEVKGLGWVRV